VRMRFGNTAAVACGWLVVHAVAVATLTLVSVEDEIAIGKQADAQVRRDMTRLRDPKTNEYVNGIGARLSKAAAGPRYPYSFTVADYREVNAFALPGGPVWVHRGLIQSATSESQLAGAMAHEIAHVAQRHAASQLTNVMVARWGISLLGAVLGNVGGAGPAQAAAGLLADGAFLKFSRDDERDADRVGLRIMTRAGWDGHGMIDLLEILRREARRDPQAVEVFFSTHPSPQERISELQTLLGRTRAGTRDSAQFQAVKVRLLHMNPPRTLAGKD
jgi:predicted Zn-dependent protease